MKKIITITLVFLSVNCYGQTAKKELPKVQAPKEINAALFLNDWIVYFRNIDRMNSFAGRGNVPSEILLATKDTLSFFSNTILLQLNKQLSDTTKKK